MSAASISTSPATMPILPWAEMEAVCALGLPLFPATALILNLPLCFTAKSPAETIRLPGSTVKGLSPPDSIDIIPDSGFSSSERIVAVSWVSQSIWPRLMMPPPALMFIAPPRKVVLSKTCNALLFNDNTPSAAKVLLLFCSFCKI